MKSVKLFVDVSLIPNTENKHIANSRLVIDFIERNVKTINRSNMIVELIPIRTMNDKKVLVDNGITKLPTILDNNNFVVGIDSIKAFINKTINGTQNRPRHKEDDAEMLRKQQMAEMDMDKYEAGEYDDDDEEDDDMFVKGDKDARKENITQKIAQFNARRKGRVEDATKGGKRGSKKKKPSTRHRPTNDDEPDNIDTDDDRGHGHGHGGHGGGGHNGTDIKMEDWDPETQQLLDKAGN